MSDVLTLQVQARDPAKNKGTGTRVARRLRAKGLVPAIVYGHKQAPQPIAVGREDAWQIIKKAAHLAELRIDGATEMVLVRDIQWDHLGKEILHLDFSRVSAEETIHTVVKLELHGHAPGVSEGGILELLVHSLEVACRADAIPDSIRVEVGDLHVGQGIHVRDLVLPPNVSVKADPDLLLLHVVTKSAPTAVTTPAEGEPGAAEPEVIGRKAEGKDEETKEDKKEKK